MGVDFYLPLGVADKPSWGPYGKILVGTSVTDEIAVVFSSAEDGAKWKGFA